MIIFAWIGFSVFVVGLITAIASRGGRRRGRRRRRASAALITAFIGLAVGCFSLLFDRFSKALETAGVSSAGVSSTGVAPTQASLISEDLSGYYILAAIVGGLLLIGGLITWLLKRGGRDSCIF